MARYNQEHAALMKRRLEEFLEHPGHNHAPYSKKVQEMLRKGESRLVIDLSHLRAWDPVLTKQLLADPIQFIPFWEEALLSFVKALPLDFDEKESVQIPSRCFIGFEGSFGPNLLSPRQLSARHIRQLVAIEGIVTKCSLVRPKLIESVHFCPETGMLVRFKHSDNSNYGSQDGSIRVRQFPQTDDKQRRLVTEFGRCVFRDHQTLVLQEMPERSPPGLLPRSVEVMLDNDLVDRCKPGDRIQVVGMYHALAAGAASTAGRGTFRTVLMASDLKPIVRADASSKINEGDIVNIKQLPQQRPKTLFSQMAASLAPSIFGHTLIKQALLLQLLGGEEHNLVNGTHLRGDINILLVGDPSTAKSQLLRFVLAIAPLALSTNGRGASGVGLTAAVTSDRDTGERRLEAGAMVLADRGVVCIDEFDKMSEDDRVAIHEVMEQQTVTIAKAGIHASLNARCSVLAAANPVYGKYNRQKRPNENIALPDSLLSRFDLLFIVLDHLSPDLDRKIADHVLRMHRFRATDSALPVPMQEEVSANATEEENVDAPTPMLAQPEHDPSKGPLELFSIPFIRKYLVYAKNRIHPRLSDEASGTITEAYAELRSKLDQKTLPITARTLETMIRLATAHAKLYLREIVTRDDAMVALSLINFALYQDTMPADKAVNAALGKTPLDADPGAAGPAADPSQPLDKKAAAEEEKRVVNTIATLRRFTLPQLEAKLKAPVRGVAGAAVPQSRLLSYLAKLIQQKRMTLQGGTYAYTS